MLAKSLHKLASPLLYNSGAYKWLWQRHAHQWPFTVVLVYHRVVADGTLFNERFGIERGISASVFESQLRFMLKHFIPSRASEVLDPHAEAMRFAVTLDDGYGDNFQIAAPILKRLGIPATFYVVSDFVGTDRLFWWEQLAEMVRTTRLAQLDVRGTLPDLVGSEGLSASLPLNTFPLREQAYERLSAAIRGDRHATVSCHLENLAATLDVMPRSVGREYELMDWRALKELVAQGHDIGGHTATHSNVVGLDSEALQREVVLPFTAIESRLSTPVHSFSYPYGHFDRTRNLAVEALKATNCRVAFIGGKGVVQGRPNAFELNRTCLNRRFSFACAYNVQDTLNHSSVVP